jgi:hypothetical protein
MLARHAVWQGLSAISVAGQSQYNAALIWKMSVKGYTCIVPCNMVK